MWQAQEFCLPGDHPSAAGHFPGHPIIPGALLLDALLAAAAPGRADVTIASAKFLRPVAHGTSVQLRWQAEGAKIRFECRDDAALVMSGTLTLGAIP